MTAMLRTLYGRLSLAFLVLFLAVGCLYALLMAYSMDMYQQEVSQKLHRDIASYVVAHNDLDISDEFAQRSVNSLFESLMVVNPNVEAGTTRARQDFALEEWFVETKLADLSVNYDFVSLRAGSQLFCQRLSRFRLCGC